MNKYELVYIIDAHATQEVKDEISKQVNDAITKSNVKLINTQVFLERHKMSFPIKKVMEGTYYMNNLEATAAALDKLDKFLRFNEQILRFLTVKLERKPA